MTTDLLRGRLLVATPNIGDPNFARTVVLLIEYGEEGALGVVLNRPSEVHVAEHLPGWAEVVAYGWDPLLGAVGTVDLNLDPDRVMPGVESVRIFAGYAGWAPRQLEAEIAEGGWFVVDALPADPLSPLPEDLWRVVLRRQSGTVALFADYPPDPSFN
jgi:putative transcriptional regulator